MPTWLLVFIAAVLVVLGAGLGALLIWARRQELSRDEAAERMRQYGVDLVRLPGRLRRVAADPRTPRRARWMLIGLAIYLASPIDLIPDFLPVIGQLDDLLIIPLVLGYVRRIIPRDVWEEHFPKREP
jgi:uncharacterized membrane protein YkvA (DUF1232 family)